MQHYMAVPGSGVKPTTTLPALRVVDAHSLPNRKASKAVRACDGADILDGLASLQNFTAKLVAMAEGVSVSSLAAARRLTPEQRDEVRGGKRPLVLPAKSVPLPPPVPVSAEERVAEVVAEFGMATTCGALERLNRVLSGVAA
jgi:hypothetical protein